MLTMRTHILSEGRLLALTGSDWLLLLGGIATWFAQGPHRREERHYRRETERLHRELEVARRTPHSELALGPDELAHSN